MKNLYYFDTSIWLDFLEDRNEHDMPKSDWAKQLITKIAMGGDKIILSDINLLELETLGYSSFEIDNLLISLDSIIIKIESTPQEISRAKDLSQKRDVPRSDALHALIARDNKAFLITFDKHFDNLKDICIPHSSKEFI